MHCSLVDFCFSKAAGSTRELSAGVAWGRFGPGGCCLVAAAASVDSADATDEFAELMSSYGWSL